MDGPPAHGRDSDGDAVEPMALSGFDETAMCTYRRTQCAVFRKTTEQFGGLSNMAAGFPIWINGHEVRTSEAIYQASRFPHLPDVQRDILAQASPMAAKMKSKPHRGAPRPDFDALRVPIMWWSLRLKLACNPVTFPRLLASTAELPIVEDSHKDRYWGAVEVKGEPGLLRGVNVLGRLLGLLRDVVDSLDQSEWQVVSPPRVHDFLLLGQPIGVVDGAQVARGAVQTRARNSVSSANDSAQTDASKSRAMQALCPSCFIVLPASGLCDNCN
jgi:ribA/ribD-fused uncharacterized protein